MSVTLINTRGIPQGLTGIFCKQCPWGSSRVLLRVDTVRLLTAPTGIAYRKYPRVWILALRVCTRGPQLALHGYEFHPCQMPEHMSYP